MSALVPAVLVVVLAAFPCAANASPHDRAFLTPSEREARLAKAASPEAYRSLRLPPQQHDYHRSWMMAGRAKRIATAQRIGEEGVVVYGERAGMQTLLDPLRKSVPIGPDSIYRDNATGKTVVLEAKGGHSRPKLTYGTPQGTNANTLHSAAGLLIARSASPYEQIQSARLIKEAQRGNLATGIVRTPHTLGSPQQPRLIASINNDNVARSAWEIERQLVRRDPQLARVFSRAAKAPANTLLRPAGHWLVPVGIGAAAVLTGYQTYRIMDMGFDDPRANYEIAATGGAAAFASVGFLLGGPFGGLIGGLSALPLHLLAAWAGDNALSEAQRDAVTKALHKHYRAKQATTAVL